MSKKRVVFICDGLSFMTNAIVDKLKKAQFEVTTANFTVADLDKYKDNASIYLLYMGDYVAQDKDSLSKLKSMCEPDDKTLCIIGNDNEFSQVTDVIDKEHISAMFTRPLDMDNLIEKLSELSSINAVIKNKKNILLVDDDSTFLKLMREWLSKKYRISMVSSGMQAITFLAKNTPDLILLDYEMPVTDGPQVLEMIRSEPKTAEIPVVFLTGKNDSESVNRVLALKPEGYILKTMHHDGFMKKIEDFFENIR